MAEQLIIQLLAETPDEAGNVQRYFRWGFADELSAWAAEAHEGDSESLLATLQDSQRPVILLIPGYRVVTSLLPYNKKEAKHFLKLLPYELEDDVLSNVDSLHFSVGAKTDETVIVAYVDRAWFSELMQWCESVGIEVEHSMADFQCLQAVGDELTLWFTGDYLWGHRANGLGFSVAQHLSQPLIKDLLANQQDPEFPWVVNVYVPDNEIKELVETHVMPPVEYHLTIGEPMFDFKQASVMDFSTGGFGKKLPVNEWWQQVRGIAVLAAVAFALFLAVTAVDIISLQKQREQNQLALMESFRSVIPSGPTQGAVRRLQARLGTGSNEANEPSNSVYLLAQIAPILSNLSIEMDTLNYSYRDQSLRVNVKAKSFNDIEQLRQRLGGQGVQAELQSSNAVDEGFQARLLIRLASESRGV